ncbi:hypothetical protein ACSQ67_009057 [Phaseolus vulgaris]
MCRTSLLSFVNNVPKMQHLDYPQNAHWPSKRPMAIGYNATISAPHMHAMCLQLLEENLHSGMHALDVGYGRAVGVEHFLELVSFSIENIQKSAAATQLKDVPFLFMLVVWFFKFLFEWNLKD